MPRSNKYDFGRLLWQLNLNSLTGMFCKSYLPTGYTLNQQVTVRSSNETTLAFSFKSITALSRNEEVWNNLHKGSSDFLNFPALTKTTVVNVHKVYFKHTAISYFQNPLHLCFFARRKWCLDHMVTEAESLSRSCGN